MGESVLQAGVEAERTYPAAPTYPPTRKRALDLIVALSLGIALTPLVLVAALLVKLWDGGPIVFWQRRVGRRGDLFWFPKLRTMSVDAESMRAALMRDTHPPDAITFKLADDPRVTSVGRLLRTLSIDELPQLWCVVRGDMSMVGPRPPLPDEVEWYDAHALRRLDVKPGLTCLWQVSGRSDLPFAQQLELDLKYIDTQSLWLDVKLLLRTIPAVLSCRGAY